VFWAKMGYIGYINKKAMQKTTIYKVYNSNKILAYKVATTTRSQQDILDIICPMYNNMKTLYKVYKNDELIHVINAKDKNVIKKPKSILEVSTGTIFKDIYEMKDVLLIDRSKALKLIKRSFNYRYV
jgi:hypothetical protein